VNLVLNLLPILTVELYPNCSHLFSSFNANSVDKESISSCNRESSSESVANINRVELYPNCSHLFSSFNANSVDKESISSCNRESSSESVANINR